MVLEASAAVASVAAVQAEAGRKKKFQVSGSKFQVPGCRVIRVAGFGFGNWIFIIDYWIFQF